MHAGSIPASSTPLAPDRTGTGLLTRTEAGFESPGRHYSFGRHAPLVQRKARRPSKPTVGVRLPGGVHAPLEERLTRQALILEIPGSAPGRKPTRRRVVTPALEGESPSGHPRVGGTAATALGCKPGIPRAGSSPARPTLASGKGVTAARPKGGCLVRVQAEAPCRASHWCGRRSAKPS